MFRTGFTPQLYYYADVFCFRFSNCYFRLFSLKLTHFWWMVMCEMQLMFLFFFPMRVKCRPRAAAIHILISSEPDGAGNTVIDLITTSSVCWFWQLCCCLTFQFFTCDVWDEVLGSRCLTFGVLMCDVPQCWYVTFWVTFRSVDVWCLGCWCVTFGVTFRSVDVWCLGCRCVKFGVTFRMLMCDVWGVDVWRLGWHFGVLICDLWGVYVWRSGVLMCDVWSDVS